MTLKDISSKYQENLYQFFSDEKIIELIYKEQYGEKEYIDNKDFYNSTFKKILKDIVFVPYITSEHLEDYINSYKSKYGEKYVQEHLASDILLLKNLQLEKNKIVKNYTNILIDELMYKYPSFTKWNKDIILKLCNSNDFSENVAIIKNNFSSNNKVKLFFITKFINKFSKTVDEKISMETSSYYFHRLKRPTNVSINDKIMKNSTCEYKICDEKNNNYYVFLPVLNYHNKHDYLIAAVHEIMHISKEKISKKKSQTGFIQENINRKNLTAYEPGSNIFSTIKWYIWAKNKKAKINISEAFENSITPNTKTTEEILNQYQVRNVVSEIKKNNLDKNLKMYYKNIEKVKTTVLYDIPDALTTRFMESFGSYIQDVNSGKLSISDFRKIVGKINFNNLTQLYSIWIADLRNRTNSSQSQNSLSTNNILSKNHYNNFNNNNDFLFAGNKIISAMEKKANIHNDDNSENKNKFNTNNTNQFMKDILLNPETLYKTSSTTKNTNITQNKPILKKQNIELDR